MNKGVVESLLSKMTIEEKVAQLLCTIPLTVITEETIDEKRMADTCGVDGIGRMTQFAYGFPTSAKTAAIAYNAIQTYLLEKTRLGIPVLIQNETLSGVVAADATIFPIPLAIASTWEPDLAREMGRIIAEECRAIGIHMGLSPVADVARDSRWGRVGETFGEDPYLVSRFCAEESKGMQGDDYGANIISCAKHFLGYSASEGGINTAAVHLERNELLEVYGTPFAAAIDKADLGAVMVTYSDIEGVPMTINEHYVNQVLKQDMGFQGTAICDALSIGKCYDENGIGESREAVVIRALKNGIDADTPISHNYQLITDAIKTGKLSEDYLDRSVGRVLEQKMRLGLFEQPFVAVDQIDEIYGRKESRQMAEQMARDSIVLLKNEGILPLVNPGKIALIGAFSDRVSTLFGGYAYPAFLEMMFCACDELGSTMEGVGEFMEKLLDKEYLKKALEIDPHRSYDENLEAYLCNRYGITTLYEAVVQEFLNTQVTYAKGYGAEEEDEQLLQMALEAAGEAELIVLTLGEITGFSKDATSGEGKDNPNLRLPDNQENLLKRLCELGKPVILILFNGRPLCINYAADHCNAIIEAWYPGPCGGEILSSILSGRCNPCGKLPITFPRSSEQCPVYYGHKAGSGYRKTRFHLSEETMFKADEKTPLFHFGHGLSYTQFDYSEMAVMEEKVAIGESFTVAVTIKNTGDRSGSEVVQVYTQTLGASLSRPVMELRGFQKVYLEKEAAKRLVFTIDTKQLGYYNMAGEFVIEPSTVRVFIGSSSADLKFEKSLRLSGAERNIHNERVFESKVIVYK